MRSHKGAIFLLNMNFNNKLFKWSFTENKMDIKYSFSLKMIPFMSKKQYSLISLNKSIIFKNKIGT